MISLIGWGLFLASCVVFVALAYTGHIVPRSIHRRQKNDETQQRITELEQELGMIPDYETVPMPLESKRKVGPQFEYCPDCYWEFIDLRDTKDRRYWRWELTAPCDRHQGRRGLQWTDPRTTSG